MLKRIRAKIRPGWLAWIGGATVLTLAIVVNAAIVGGTTDQGNPAERVLPDAGSSGGSGDGGNKGETPRSARSTHTTATTTPAGRAPEKSVTPGIPVFGDQGSGAFTTAKFEVPRDWDLAWTFGCSKLPGGKGTFTVKVLTVKGVVDPDSAGFTRQGEHGSGTQNYHSGGVRKSLQVVTECDWAVTVASGAVASRDVLSTG